MTEHKRDYTVDRRLLGVSSLALVVGAVSSLSALVLVELIHLFTNLFFFHTVSLANRSPAQNQLGPWVVLVPVAGGLIVGLMARFGSERIRGHGIPEAMETILYGKSKMSPRVAALKPLSSGIVIGSGGPFGAEGPIIMTGGSLGSLIAQYFHLTAVERKTLLVAGACAGMTAIFNTPLAALLLAVELLLFELRPRSLMPVALACAVAGFVRPWLMGSGAWFPLHTDPPTTVALMSCIAAGLISAVLAIILTAALYRTEDWFAALKVHWMWWPAIGAVAVGIGGYFQPRALGVGYDVIGDLLRNHLAMTAVLALLAVKAVIWIAALGSGTSGGILAPVLMLGAGAGIIVSPWLPGGSPSLWALVCMSGVLGSLLGAPLTAIVFAVGLTHDPDAILPLLLTTAVAYGLTTLTLKRSIMTEKIARRGLHVLREYGLDPLETQHVSDVMNTRLVTIDAALSADQALARYFGADQRFRAYPVVDGERLVGLLERAAFGADAGVGRGDPARTCGDLATPPDPQRVLLPQDSARFAAGRLAQGGMSRMAVVSDLASMRLVGLVALPDLVAASRQIFEEETVRERLR